MCVPESNESMLPTAQVANLRTGLFFCKLCFRSRFGMCTTVLLKQHCIYNSDSVGCKQVGGSKYQAYTGCIPKTFPPTTGPSWRISVNSHTIGCSNHRCIAICPITWSTLSITDFQCFCFHLLFRMPLLHISASLPTFLNWSSDVCLL
jgi:hypothetical protein